MNMERILIVDDEQDHLDILAEVLAPEFDIATARNGREGLRAMDSMDDLVLVISDLDMPVMDGAEFLQLVRILRPEIYRILMSGRIKDPGFDQGILIAPEPHLVIPKPIQSAVKLRSDLKALRKP